MTLPRKSDSGSLAQHVAAATATRAARMLTGNVTRIDPTGTVSVNVDGRALDGLSLPGGVVLRVGDPVSVLRQGGTYRVSGLITATPHAETGVVQTVTGNYVTVTPDTGSGDLQCSWVGTWSPTVGEAVWLAWLGSRPIVLGPVPGTPPNVVPPQIPVNVPAPDRYNDTYTFTSTGSGTYSGVWLDNTLAGGNVIQGTGYSGVWFSGGKPHATLAGQLVDRAWVWIGRDVVGSGSTTAHLARVVENTRPAGAPTFDLTNTLDIPLLPGQSGWFDLPTSFAQALVDTGGSVGVSSSTSLRLLGRTQDTRAGQLRITWHRNS